MKEINIKTFQVENKTWKLSHELEIYFYKNINLSRVTNLYDRFPLIIRGFPERFERYIIQNVT